MRSFAMVGASGLVGGELAKLLAADPRYQRGTLIGRRAVGLPAGVDGARVSEVVIDFDRADAAASLRAHLAVDDVFCCLGTTIKKAGSQEAFRKVDHDLPLTVAREARAAGARRYFIITAVGADASSRVFYSRVKGEVETALAALEFPGGLDVFRPSLILGERAERRPAERIAMGLMGATRGLFAGSLARYRAITAVEIARAMRRAALEEPGGSGVRVHEGEGLFALAT